MYAISFTEAGAKGIPRTQKLLSQRTINYECKVIKKSEDHYQESQEEASTKEKEVN